MKNIKIHITRRMENAGMDKAKYLFGFGVTRAAVAEIFNAMVMECQQEIKEEFDKSNDQNEEKAWSRD